MKILMINVVCGIRSTGRICTDLADELTRQGHKVKIAYGREHVPMQYQRYSVRISNDFDVYFHAITSRLFDSSGFGSRWYTEQFIKWVKKYDPDVIHLHNLHGYYIHVGVLFEYLKTCKKKIIWTLHDCWAFTGHCVFFESVNCRRWIDGCYHCPQKCEYPKSWIVDSSVRNYKEKQRIFSNIPDLTIFTPSEWLAKLVKHSFLKEYPVKVVHNGINTGTFRPTDSRLRKKYRLQNKTVILGVAALWEERKGLKDIIALSKILDDTHKIVLIGMKRSHRGKVPSNIITVGSTNSQKELAKFYTMADVFINPTYEDNYPSTNLESIACGTPVISYKTGGSSESAQMYGIAIEPGYRNLYKEIMKKRKYEKKEFDISIENAVDTYITYYTIAMPERKGEPDL